MRKADYTRLAQLIKAQLIANKNIGVSSNSLINIARDFANGASVDKTTFLRQCGIE